VCRGYWCGGGDTQRRSLHPPHERGKGDRVILNDRTKALREKLFDIDAKVSEITKES
jgi:hypothetical protein